MKKCLIVAVWVSLISFVVLNLNFGMFAGVLLGIIYRLLHGSAISFVIGGAVGVLFVELTKFISYKF